MTTTRWTTISSIKLCEQGRAYEASWLGLRARWVSEWTGEAHEGAIESVRPYCGAVIRFDDGRWARTHGMSVQLVTS